MRSNRRRRNRLFASLRRAVGANTRILSRRRADGALVPGRPPVKVLASVKPIAIEADKGAHINYWEGTARRNPYDMRQYGHQGAWGVSW